MDLANITARLGRTLTHRGPDDSGIWIDAAAGVGIAHARLSVIDVSASGSQPMVALSGRYVIAYNGEVYNFRELRQELRRSGARFIGGSDTEVLLAAIEAWGVDEAVGRLIGMFAFALWDTSERRLTLVRDRLGIKPLYWAESRGNFIFGSELKAILAFPGWTREVDRDSLAAYARWNYVPTPNSILKGAHKLAPGSILQIRAGETPKISRYWDLRRVAQDALAQPLTMTDQEATDSLDGLLADSVKRRMVSDVPIGAFLSGGIDSSLVTALMQAQSNTPVRTFTIGFRDEAFDEAPFARAISKHLGTDHTELYVDPDAAMSIIPKLPYYYDEPFADSSQIPAFLIAELTRQSVTVTLSGDGGDELFAGYTRYFWANMVNRRFGALPRPFPLVCSAIAGLGCSVARLARSQSRPERQGSFGDRLGKLAIYLREPNGTAVYRRQHTHWSAPSAVVLGGCERKDTPDIAAFDEINDLTTRMQLLDTSMYLPDDILTKLDRATMSVGLEARVPLLDHRLVEFAWRLPMDQKVRSGKGKWILRNVLERYVPNELVERPKRGFGVPIGNWLRGPLRDWAENLISESRLRDEGYFSPRLVRNTWQRFVDGKNTEQDAIWGILMFQAWVDTHLTGKPVPPSAFSPATN